MSGELGQRSLDMQRFLTASARIFSTHRSIIGDILAQHLKSAASNLAPLPETPCPNPPALTGLLRRAPSEVAQPLSVCSRFFQWRRPGFGALPRAVADKIEVAEIVGPDAVLPDRQIRFGLLLQQQDHIYPEHNHAAEELYFILAGQADWVKDNDDPKPLGAGRFVHHEPWQQHAMSTGSEPMLALWGWAGQIDADAYRFNQTI